MKGIEDIKACLAKSARGIEGVIAGRALYDGRLDLRKRWPSLKVKRGKGMLSARVIPCLDVHAGRVVKGVNFVNLVDAGDPVEQARIYDAAGADELCFLDITATHEGRETIYEVIAKTADACFMPLTVGGGVRDVTDFRKLLLCGADRFRLILRRYGILI